MYPSARQFPDEPGVDGTHEQLAPFRSIAGAVHVVKNPLGTAGGEVRVDEQAAAFAYELGVAPLLQVLADVRSTLALPHDSMTDRLAREPVPHHDGLALVSDGERVGGVGVRPSFHQLTDGLHRVAVDFLGIVLYPSYLRIVLVVRHVLAVDEAALLVEQHRLRG